MSINVDRFAPRARVLVVEDDEAVRHLLTLLLEDEGFEVTDVATGEAAVQHLEHRPCDLVLLDVRLPGMNGFDVCRQVRRTNNVAIIMVTAQNDSHDVVSGLELGADDYVTKPFNDHELLARVRVQMRRRVVDVGEERMTFGALEIFPAEGVVRLEGEDLSLTRTEFQLLCHFGRSPNRVWTREQLLEHVWGYEHHGDTRLVDTHVARLRAKIERNPAAPSLLVTVRGLGYKLIRIA